MKRLTLGIPFRNVTQQGHATPFRIAGIIGALNVDTPARDISATTSPAFVSGLPSGDVLQFAKRHYVSLVRWHPRYLSNNTKTVTDGALFAFG